MGIVSGIICCVNSLGISCFWVSLIGFVDDGGIVRGGGGGGGGGMEGRVGSVIVQNNIFLIPSLFIVFPKLSLI